MGVSEMHTGLECGSNNFFYRRMENVKELGLEDHFTPLLTLIRLTVYR